MKKKMEDTKLAKNALTENSLRTLDAALSYGDENYTANDLAEKLDATPRQANAWVTALQKRGLVERVPATVELEDGKTKAIKFVKVTAAGQAYDHAAAEAADAAEAAEKKNAKLAEAREAVAE